MKTILSYLKPYRMQCIAILIVALADVAGSLLVPTITAEIINLAVAGTSMEALLDKSVVMLVISLISGALTILGAYLCACLSANFGRDLRDGVYDKSLQLSATDFEEFGTASMITRTQNDINTIQEGLVYFMQMILPVPMMCVLGIYLSYRIHPHMGHIILGSTIVVLAMALFIIVRASSIFEKLQMLLDRMNVVLRENLTGVRVIRAFNKEKFETSRMQETFTHYAQKAIEANRLFVGLDCLALVATNLCIVLIVYLGGNAVGAGGMEIGDITAVIEYAGWILYYIMMAQMVILMLPRALTCIRRVSAVLEKKPEIADGEREIHVSASKSVCLDDAHPSDRVVDVMQGGDASSDILRFDHVTFQFADADEPMLSDISFSCKKGTTTAIIGGTGSGKSTIAKLLLRVHDVTEGSVSFAGTDVRELTQESLRAHISYVPQKAYLFAGTIAENLRYGKEEASEEERIRALRIAQSDFVFSLPEKMETMVSQGGTNFSGGQRQRLAIARALVKPAELYVFDDSFSALDFKTDAALRRALSEEMKDAALLIIAQRISTIVHADCIIVLDDGQIAGIGTHEELMKSCKIYQEIARSQMKGGE